MDLIKKANEMFTKEILENNFIENLKSKGYYELDIDIEDLFLKCLVEKGYITKSNYDKLLCDSKNIKHFKSKEDNETTDSKNKGKVKKENRVTFSKEEDTYDILDENLIDYESVHIEGIEYYFNGQNLNIAENINYTDVGIWDCDTQKINFIKEEFKCVHIERVESIGGNSSY